MAHRSGGPLSILEKFLYLHKCPKTNTMSSLVGHISQIIGPVVDVHFNLSDDNQTSLPSIHEALLIKRSNGKELIVEVQQHIGEDTVRTVAVAWR